MEIPPITIKKWGFHIYHLLRLIGIDVSKKIGGMMAMMTLCFASASTYAEEFTNFFGIKLIDIPAGSFDMGSCKVTKQMEINNIRRAWLGIPQVSTGCISNDKNMNDNETPQHKVNIGAFRIGVTPITLGQYKKYLLLIGTEDEESSWNLINEEFNRLNNYGDNAPVVQVSWNEARKFIHWLNENKPKSDRHIYRFLSEAEWEYACRAGEKHTYCGSNNLNDVGWVDLDLNSSQRAVASKAPNAWGVYDMTGNVWEWVGDIYHETYDGAPDDGSVWLADNEVDEKTREAQKSAAWKRDTRTSRVLRGGSWRFGTGMATATYRLSGQPGNWYYGNGFRIAATLAD